MCGMGSPLFEDRHAATCSGWREFLNRHNVDDLFEPGIVATKENKALFLLDLILGDWIYCMLPKSCEDESEFNIVIDEVGERLLPKSVVLMALNEDADSIRAWRNANCL